MGLLRSLLGKLGRSPEPPQSSSSSKPEIVRLADVPSEYEYLERVKCRACGGATSSSRRGSKVAKEPSNEGGVLRPAVMHDFWVITCKSCKLTRELVLEVPSVSLDDFPRIAAKFRRPIQGGSIEFHDNPSVDEVRRRFADQTFDSQSVRQEVLENLIEFFDSENKTEQMISRPIFMLAFADLTLSEFIMTYVSLHFYLARMKNPDQKTPLTYEAMAMQLPESVMMLLEHPHSAEARKKCLDFLLRDD